ncbi:DUF4349 domain-containing protein [Alienimonas chondri]|uniref:DUF4349 domain-containing protein n=1 Tax=Alienimonas chondri TaxID=2681879 RepID=A0ABX1VKV0_9PLAN|nr:DUF4349 domain-containing protein [Alienimonas chondri]NNJ27707.1 hypothetical protein [Alienimonas chondri]
MSRSIRFPLAALALLLLAGCGAEATFDRANVSAPAMKGGTEESYEMDAAGLSNALTIQMPIDEMVAGQEGRPTDPAPTADSARPAAAKPKIIYTADLTVVVENFEGVEQAIPALVDKFGGYVAASDVDRSMGDRLRGTWTVRIPVASYDAFLAGAGGLGVVEEKGETARDVTAEFVDTEARLAGRRALETRLLELLAERPGELKDVLELERELARVREEIETAEGRLRYLSNQTAYSTITLQVREERDYVPPRRPGFGERIASTWDASLEALASFGRGLVLFLVAVAPFAVVIGLPIVLLFWLLIRRLRRVRTRRQPEARAEAE